MKIRVAIAHMDAVQGEQDRNFQRGISLIAEAARRGMQLVCFPEMRTGLDWASNRQVAADPMSINGETPA
jgi:predicted amidohydrolase